MARGDDKDKPHGTKRESGRPACLPPTRAMASHLVNQNEPLVRWEFFFFFFGLFQDTGKAARPPRGRGES